MSRFAADFNKMTGQLAAMIKNSAPRMLRWRMSSLLPDGGDWPSAGMLDGVFDTPQQLEMKQLQHLNRLTAKLHLLSRQMPAIWCSMNPPFCLDEGFPSERAAWLTPQADAQSVTIAIQPSPSCPSAAMLFAWGPGI